MIYLTRINLEDIINTIIPTNSYGDIKVLKYIGKDKDYLYEIQFLNTNNIETVTRSSIKRNSCVDTKLKKENHKKNMNKKIANRKKLNENKEQQIIYTNKKLFKTLALDQSTTGTAYAIYIDQQLIKYGKIDTSDLSDPILKIIKIRNEVQSIIEKENIDLLAIEDIYMAYNVHTFKTLAILYGMLEILSVDNNIMFISQVSYQWKQGIGIALTKLQGKNRRDKQKQSSKELANLKFGLNLTDDDISDAILIGYHTVINCIKRQEYEEGKWS